MPRGVDIVTSLDGRQQRVCIEVRDTGTGIPPQVRDKLFLPYFTTKKGVRLGASACQSHRRRPRRAHLRPG